MEHAQNTRTVLAAAVVLVAATTGLAGCATASPAAGADAGRAVVDDRALMRASAERYVQEQLDRGRRAVDHRLLVREAAEQYVEGLIERARAATYPPASPGVTSVPSDEDPRGRHGLSRLEIAQLRQRLGSTAP